MLNTTNIIQNIICLINKNKGSSLLSLAHGWCGASIFTAFLYLLSTPPSASRKKSGKAQAGGQKGRGFWGEEIFALLRLKTKKRFRFSLIKRKAKQINFLFLLKEKRAREKNKKCRENLSVLVPPKQNGGRRAETHIIILDFVQRKFEPRPENTAKFHFQQF